MCNLHKCCTIVCTSLIPVKLKLVLHIEAWTKCPGDILHTASNALTWKKMFASCGRYLSSDAMWWHKSLAQVMACCLAAPSYYLHQYWLITSVAFRHSHEGNCTGNAPDIYSWYEFENYQYIEITIVLAANSYEHTFSGNVVLARKMCNGMLLMKNN